MSDIMQPTVDEICRSLREEPNKWVFTTYTFHKSGADAPEFWGGDDEEPITSMWNGATRSKVFSLTQGVQIREAYCAARLIQASEEQLKIMAKFIPQPATTEYVGHKLKSLWERFVDLFAL
ncbi:hypothetical protein D3C85_566440 [compost metagenome]